MIVKETQISIFSKFFNFFVFVHSVKWYNPKDIISRQIVAEPDVT